MRDPGAVGSVRVRACARCGARERVRGGDPQKIQLDDFLSPTVGARTAGGRRPRARQVPSVGRVAAPRRFRCFRVALLVLSAGTTRPVLQFLYAESNYRETKNYGAESLFELPPQ